MYYEIPGIIQDLGHVNDYINGSIDEELIQCNDDCGEGCFCGIGLNLTGLPEGWYRLVTETYWGTGGVYYDFALDITDFYYDK